MLNKLYKGGLLLGVVVFSFLSFYSIIFAANYGAGLYNSGLYSTTPPSTPMATPSAGLYNATQSVTLSATGTTSIRYSLTGIPTSCSSDTLYSSPISVSTTETIYVRACDSYGNSSTGSFAYTLDTIPPSTPTATPSAGTYNSVQSVTLNATGSDYIKYGTSLPANCGAGTSYAGPIDVLTSGTIYVRACDNAGNSSTANFAYVVDTTIPLTPVATPSSGIYNTTQSVALSATGSDSIRYSVTSTPADCTSGTLYTTAISVSTSETIYARACDVANNSSTGSFAYTIDTTSPEAIIASPIAGLYNATQSVILNSVGSDYIKYGSSMPTDCSSGASYTGPIDVSTSQTIYARACDDADNSTTGSFAYNIDTIAPSVPIATPSSGIYNAAQTVSLSATGSDYIKYGSSLPSDCSAGTLYSTLINVSSSQTIYARACDNAGNSSITSFAYIINTDAPETATASPSAGTYSSSQTITLTANGSDTIRYGTTGIPATCSSDTLYTGPISITTSTSIYVRACDSIGNSSVTIFAYVISTPSSSSYSSGTTLAYRTKFLAEQQALSNPVPTTSVSTFTFTKNLKLKITSPDVKELQKYLNSKGYIIAKTGPGSLGHETNYFGPATKQALIKFQKAKKLTPDGIVGSKTRTLMK